MAWKRQIWNEHYDDIKDQIRSDNGYFFILQNGNPTKKKMTTTNWYVIWEPFFSLSNCTNNLVKISVTLGTDGPRTIPCGTPFDSPMFLIKAMLKNSTYINLDKADKVNLRISKSSVNFKNTIVYTAYIRWQRVNKSRAVSGVYFQLPDGGPDGRNSCYGARLVSYCFM